MIANARMYSVSQEAAVLWRRLLGAVIEHSGLEIELFDHPDSHPISELWQRGDKAAVFMCGLPYSLSDPRPELIAAPVPSPPGFGGAARYWSELVVRTDSKRRTLSDTFGGRIALTVPDSQSGCAAALYHLMTAGGPVPPYEEIITPRITPLGAMSAVIDGAADVAPIDSYAYRLLEKFRPELTSQLSIVARTAPTPIPPLVASGSGLGRLQAAFLDAHRIPAAAPLMTALLLERFVRPDPASYDRLRTNFQAAGRYWSEHPLARTVHPAFAGAPAPFAETAGTR